MERISDYYRLAVVVHYTKNETYLRVAVNNWITQTKLEKITKRDQKRSRGFRAKVSGDFLRRTCLPFGNISFSSNFWRINFGTYKLYHSPIKYMAISWIEVIYNFSHRWHFRFTLRGVFSLHPKNATIYVNWIIMFNQNIIFHHNHHSIGLGGVFTRKSINNHSRNNISLFTWLKKKNNFYIENYTGPSHDKFLKMPLLGCTFQRVGDTLFMKGYNSIIFLVFENWRCKQRVAFLAFAIIIILYFFFPQTVHKVI